jgi:hypothetical protein
MRKYVTIRSVRGGKAKPKARVKVADKEPKKVDVLLLYREESG